MESIIGTFMVASLMPILKVLLMIVFGFFLALDRVDVLGKTASHHLNRAVYYVLSPLLVGSNLAKTITFKSFLNLWFIPVNILIIYMVGSALGWLIGKLTRAPKHIKGLIIASCSSGNFGSLLLIFIPAMCKEKGSPFGLPDDCVNYGLAYSSLAIAVGNMYMWLYVYNILRISSKDVVEKNAGTDCCGIREQDPEQKDTFSKESTSVGIKEINQQQLPSEHTPTVSSVDIIFSMARISFVRTKECLMTASEKINLKAILAPSAIAAMVAFFIGMIPPLRNLLIGHDAPLHIVTDSAFMIGEAAIPCMILLTGANLLRGLKGAGVQRNIVTGIMAVRFIFLPLLGILVVKGAVHAGLVQAHDRLLHFVLMLQYAVPPAMNIGTITRMFGAAQRESSVILLWTYAFAAIALTLWSTLYLYILAN